MIILYILSGLLLLLIGVVTFRTLTFTTATASETNMLEPVQDVERLAEKLSHAVRVKTVSYMDKSKIDYSTFTRFQQVIKEDFPLIHEHLELTVINDYSLLYQWKGSKRSGLPGLFMAHIDVVPVSEKNEKSWTHGPFSGDIVDGHVWGRGTLDTKNTLIATMEAVERLLEEGFQPENDIYMAFGHDEEIQSTEGALKIVEYLKEQGVKLDFVMDEGGIVSVGSIPGITVPVGLIGIGEKGAMDVKVAMAGEEGHASMPPRHTALGHISQLIASIEDQPMKMQLLKPVREFLLVIGPKMGLSNRIILSNLWLFEPVFKAVFSKSHSGNAMLRTTVSATMAEGSSAPNVLPKHASATFNVRINLGDSVDSVIDYIEKSAKGNHLEIEILQSKEPSKISPTDVRSYELIKQTIPKVFGDVLVAPYVVLAATDSVKYECICDNLYRFAPMKLTQEELGTIHGTNERISFENLERSLRFYMEMIRSL